MRYRHPILLLISILFISSNLVIGQENKITLDEIYRDFTFYSKSVRGINSMNDGNHYTVNHSGTSINKHSYADGELIETLFNAEDFDAIQSFNSYEFSLDEQYILLTTETESIYRRSFLAAYYVYDINTKKLSPLSPNGKQQLASISPNNETVAFVRENNIYLVDLESMVEMQLTYDGKKNEIINGAPDWVYEEEFGFAEGFKWSPDGNKLAFYRFDESQVKEFFMSMYGELYPKSYEFKYPKAGERNSDVSILVYDRDEGMTIELQIPSDEEFYIPRIKWTNDPDVLSVIWLNRLQNQVKILHCNAKTSDYEVVFEETNDKYISEATDNMITYLPDNESFLLISERDKYFHFYNYNFKTKELSAVTKGEWDINSLLGVDKKRGIVYYTSYEESPTEIHLYSIKLDGSNKKKLSTEPGSYTANFSSTYDYYILSHSTANTPPVYELYNKKGKLIRVLEDNADLKKTIKDYHFSDIEFMQVPTASGQNLNGYMIKPADFDPNKQYPLFIYVYGGPESQNVVNSWNRRAPWFQMLVQEGYIVACVDNRGTNGRGEEFRKSTYMQLGKLETIDQVEAATYLGDLPYVNKDRIGIFGWSYGGFMTSLCLTKGNGVFKMGIAVAPVTNWRYYDTVYTERFMRTPQENPEGYDDNSPINFTDQLQGKLLLVHGTADDNVHFQNSIDFVSALVESNAQFEMQFYPNKNHGIYGGNTTYHLYTRMTDFIFNNL
ncbi:MAG: S9 family peptidase [Bacteroidales bacterium]|jgi:dipeptidyl-peptidase-4|nr:S9 family peptidase [Bacteroidales bacterium]